MIFLKVLSWFIQSFYMSQHVLFLVQWLIKVKWGGGKFNKYENGLLAI